MVTSRRPVLGAAAVMAAVLLAGCGAAPLPQSGPVPTTTPAATAAPSSGAVPTPRARAGTRARTRPAVPVQVATPPPAPRPGTRPALVQLPGIDVTADVEAVGVDDQGLMQLPEHPDRAGWYRWSPAPGSAEGTTVLGAHVDSLRFGVGPFARLQGSHPGDEVRVRRADGRLLSYRITTVQRIEKTALRLDQLFSVTGPPRLVLLTCGGAFDRNAGGYQDNVVVTAEPAPAAG